MEKITNYYLPSVPHLIETILPIKDSELNEFQPISPTENNNIGIIIVHFLRDKLLLETVKSIFKYAPGVKLYIADQGVYNENLEKFYKKLIDAGHVVIYAGYDAGISRCRNLLVSIVKEPFIYWQDDDVCFTKETDLNTAIEILAANDDIGIVGMQELTNNKINHYEMFLEIKNDTVIYSPAWSEDMQIDKKFYFCDMVINDAIAKKEIFNNVLWDENLKLTEHLDFFLQIKYNTQWHVCYINSFLSHQDIIIEDENYKQFRGRNKYFWQYYIDKWNVHYIHNLEFKSKAPWKIEIFNIKKNILQPKIDESINNEKILQKIDELKTVPSSDIEQHLKIFIQILEENSYEYCLLQTTCAEIVCKGKITAMPLTIAIPNYNHQLESILHQYGYRYCNDCWMLNNIKFKIYTTKFKTKEYTFKNKTYFVPMPVVGYLKNIDLWTE